MLRVRDLVPQSHWAHLVPAHGAGPRSASFLPPEWVIQLPNKVIWQPPKERAVFLYLEKRAALNPSWQSLIISKVTCCHGWDISSEDMGWVEEGFMQSLNLMKMSLCPVLLCPTPLASCPKAQAGLETSEELSSVLLQRSVLNMLQVAARHGEDTCLWKKTNRKGHTLGLQMALKISFWQHRAKNTIKKCAEDFCIFNTVERSLNLGETRFTGRSNIFYSTSDIVGGGRNILDTQVVSELFFSLLFFLQWYQLI